VPACDIPVVRVDYQGNGDFKNCVGNPLTQPVHSETGQAKKWKKWGQWFAPLGMPPLRESEWIIIRADEANNLILGK
jgi:hypothetical protein